MERCAVGGDRVSPTVAVDDHVETVDEADEEELPPGDVHEGGGDGVGAEVVDEGKQPEAAACDEDHPEAAHAHARRWESRLLLFRGDRSAYGVAELIGGTLSIMRPCLPDRPRCRDCSTTRSRRRPFPGCDDLTRRPRTGTPSLQFPLAPAKL